MRGCAAQCATKVRDIVAGGASRVEYHGRADDVPGDLARYIDHTLLKPDATAAEIDRLCAEAAEHRFAAVCINPTWVRRRGRRTCAARDVAVASVVGFPFGASTSEVKAIEARRAIRDGAREIDMVINIGALKSGMHEAVREDIARVSDACHESGAANKVIIETALLTDEEKVIACRLAQEAKADFVKTSTGYAKGGATVFDVALMREVVGPRMGVKAAGGIRTAEDVQDMIAAGATRIGASAGVKIVTGEKGAHGSIDLRAYVFLDSLQAQYAAFLGTVAQGFLPLAGDASLSIEVSPGIEINRLTDIALKSTSVKPGMQIIERYYGMLEIHSPSQAEVRAAGAAILGEIGLAETDRIKPRILSSQIIRRIDDHQAQLINRTRHGQMLIGGQTLYVLEMEPAAYAALAANEAEKAAQINILEVRSFGSMGRVYLGGEERDIDVGWRAAVAAIEGIEGRDAKA